MTDEETSNELSRSAAGFRELAQRSGPMRDEYERRAERDARAAQALRVKGMLVEALERIRQLTAHDPKTTRADAFANLNRISGAAESALAEARKEPT